MQEFGPSINMPWGFGIYTLPEAAQLLQVSSQKLTRWAEGYVYYVEGEARNSGPVIDRGDSERGIINFYDLIELFFVREFRKAGVTLQNIRRDANILRERLNNRYPFASRRFVELNRQIVDSEEMRTIYGKQQVFEFGRNFFLNIDFDEFGLAKVWHPLGKGKLIVLDPSRSFGAPIEIRSGVRTEVLYNQFLLENDIEIVSDWYEVAPDGVRQAIEFEEQCRVRAA